MGTFIGSACDDRLIGTGEGDNMDGLAGNDILLGCCGDDILVGGTGADSMAGECGNDSYSVDNVCDVLLEWANQGTDVVFSSVDWTLGAHFENLALNTPGSVAITGRGNGLANWIGGNGLDNRLYGNGGADTIHGALGDDTLSGGSGDDALFGDDGNDRLYGGAGSDLLSGGRGADMYMFTRADAASPAIDSVRFNSFDGDRINVRAIDAIAGGANDAFTFIGGADFSGTAGELRVQAVGGWGIYDGPNSGSGAIYLVTGDTNGDAVADFTIQIMMEGHAPMDTGDFVL